MDNSNKPSPSNVQDAGKKEGLAKKMKAAKAPVKMQKSPKKVGLPKNLVNFKKSSKEVTKKSLAKTPTKKSTTSPKGMKTRANSNRGSLDSLMAGFQTEGQTKTALGMPLKDLSESAVGLLISHYKVDNEKVLSTTALAM